VSRLLLRNLLHFWRTNLAVVAGVATAVAVLTGALTVGGSVRQSLRDLVVQRLGSTDVVVASDRFFREDLAAAFHSADEAGATTSSPIIHLQGVLTRESARLRTRTVQVYGVDDRFWRFHGLDRSGPDDRTALVGSALADALGIAAGETLLLRIETPGAVPRESLYGRRENVGRTIRLTCGSVIGTSDLGEFALRSSQEAVLAIFVPLARLQRDLGQAGRVNTVLVGASPGPVDPERVRAAIDRAVTLQDLGVTLRPLPSGRGVAVESSRLLLDEALARAARGAAADAGVPASGVFSYLANAIRANGRTIPYSVITATDIGHDALASIRPNADSRLPQETMAPGEAIWLNEWAARDLSASAGNPVEVDYYRWLDDGRLVEETARFRVAGVVAIAGDVDTTMAPDVPGISDARDMTAWDPPFPMDLGRIRPADEDYWERYRATPKAFVSLARGQELWSSRHGRLSSVRMAWVPGSAFEADPTEAAVRVGDRLRARLDPEAGGFLITPVRANGLEASRGSTDFGEYFVYFSFFLIAAAVLLAAMFFRLGVEQRVREIGTLQAVGFSTATIRRLFLLEGVVLSGVGSLLGLLGAVAYGGVLVVGLRTWWIDAVGTSQVFLHVSARDLGVGAAAGMIASLGAVLWALRGLRHASARAMLAGVLESSDARRQRSRVLGIVAAAALLGAVALSVGAVAGHVPDVAGFFGTGVLLLVAILSAMTVGLRHTPVHPITKPGWLALVRLGARHLTYRPGRSLLCVALIAFATFVIVSVEGFRKDARAADHAPTSGTGGFPLVLRTALPVFENPNGEAGREALGIGASDRPALTGIRFVPFRERAGEDASCLNLYAPAEPRILGAPSSFIREGRFAFQASLAATAEQQRNPWLLLEAPQADGAIPAVGDANTLQYVLHVAIGDEVVVRGDGGAPVRLRLVGALRDTILQGELIIAEASFLRAFPDREGFRVFLLETDAARAGTLVAPLEESLSDWGAEVELSADRLAAFHRVENTYLSTFQSLGTLGLILGTFGLAAVLLRNVLERRREIGLLRAVGYGGGAIAFIVVVENVLLMLIGLASGAASAMVAIVPALLARGGAVPVAAAGTMLVVVLIGGVLSSLVAVVAVSRMPLLGSLRSE
jgi:ABC-type lipoprotein release transport system permease subunit